ncbi:hypothetical protein E2C01_038238 [Portunus trituberculatus]|uniref:Uncharacterized protein n=1 Tax=Portunus trituberculatus TaxID=210409 RepID=A0A5B7FDM7_PORTR|nr:hypothetical protein [Portunus trituberculatus]
MYVLLSGLITVPDLMRVTIQNIHRRDNSRQLSLVECDGEDGLQPASQRAIASQPALPTAARERG